MAIKEGDTIPSGSVTMMTGEGPKPVSTDDLFKGKKVVVFAVPGAFTPTCSAKHLPGFVDKAQEIKSKGVNTIACIAVNDAFVMDAWGKAQNTAGKVEMLADGSSVFTDALGLGMDLTERGLGKRSRRYSMIVDNGVVKKLNLEEGGAFQVSDAQTILKQL